MTIDTHDSEPVEVTRLRISSISEFEEMIQQEYDTNLDDLLITASGRSPAVVSRIMDWVSDNENTEIYGNFTVSSETGIAKSLDIKDIFIRGDLDMCTILDFISDFEGLHDLRVEDYDMDKGNAELRIHFD